MAVSPPRRRRHLRRHLAVARPPLLAPVVVAAVAALLVAAVAAAVVVAAVVVRARAALQEGAGLRVGEDREGGAVAMAVTTMPTTMAAAWRRWRSSCSKCRW